MKLLTRILLALALVLSFTAPVLPVSGSQELSIAPVTQAQYGLTENPDGTHTYQYEKPKTKIKVGGDTSFIPKIQTYKFDDYHWFSLELNGIGLFEPTVSADGKIEGKAIDKDFSITYAQTGLIPEFNDEGGLDIFITTGKDASNNVLEFTFDSLNIDAYFQPELTQAEIDEGAFRPEHVINSVAFYCSDQGGVQEVGGIEWKTGKVGHLYRMHASSYNGKVEPVWCDWSVDGDIISLTIPADWYNNPKVKFPITIAPVGDTFGYTSVGGTSTYGGTNALYGVKYALGASGDITDMRFYTYNEGPSINFKGVIYGDSASYPGALLDVSSVYGTPGSPGWVITDNAVASCSAADYWLGWVGGGNSVFYWYDAGTTNQRYYKLDSYASPSDPYPAGGTGAARKVSIYCTYTSSGGSDPPTVTTDAADDLEDTTATLNGTVTDDGGETIDYYGFVWDDDSDEGDPGDVDPSTPAGTWENGWKSASGDYGMNPFDHAVTGLPTGTTIYFRAAAHNTNGWSYGAAASFLTKPAAPTNVAATDGVHYDKVVVTWTKSTGATGYKIYRDGGLLDTVGDVATYDDTDATPAVIGNFGTVTASDGTSSAHVTLSIAGESTMTTSYTYKLKATNGTGDSDDSDTDTGYRGVGAITYQWQVDDGGGFDNIVGGTTDPYNYVGAPAPTITPGNASASDGTSAVHVVLSIAGTSGSNGATYDYQCVLSADGADNSPHASSNTDTGYRVASALSYEWFRSVMDADADFGSIAAEGATTAAYNDTHGAVDPDARYYYCNISMADAADQATTHDDGYIAAGGGGTGETIFIPLLLPFSWAVLSRIRRKRRKVT